MTTSSGLFGLPKNLSYAVAKGGIVGMTRSLAAAGRKHGIRVNALAPAAQTRMAGPPSDGAETQLAAGLVAPMAAFLAHEDCPVTGEIYAAGAGRFSRIFLASTPGYIDADPSVEDIAANWAAINDESGYTVPADLMAWSATFLAHLPAGSPSSPSP
jgi:NAD(P)-dependent dehydrogenase (short-subunit alcohol dehydrogenase family)